MINSFSQFLVEEEKAVYFTFGRMNPPTIGHGKLLDKLASVAGRNPYRIFLSQSNDPKENPLPYADKIKHVRKMFPKHARSVIVNKKAKTPFFALSALYDEGFRKVVMVAGSDRVAEYDLRLNKYNGKKGPHGFYNFEGGIKIVSAGQRDPDAKGAEGASGTKQRGFAKDNNFTSFAQNLPRAMSNANAKRLFNDVRRGMGLKEQKQFRNHVQLQPVSELREAYVKDGLFSEGDEVVILKNDVVGNIQHLGANYVIVESKGERYRCWLNDITKVGEDIKITYDKAPYEDPGDDGVIRESFYHNKEEEHFDLEDITADFSTEKQGALTVSFRDLSEGVSLNEAVKPKWKRGGPDGEVHTIHKGKHWRVRKDYNHNDRHVGEYRIEYKKKNPYGGHDWEWHDTVYGKEHAKSRLPEGVSMYADKPDWGTPESTKKAKKITPGEVKERSIDQVKDIISNDKQQIAKDKEAMKKKHDRMMDRARRSRMLRKNKGIKP